MGDFQLQAARRGLDSGLHLLHSVRKARQVFTWIDRFTRRAAQGQFQFDQLVQTEGPQGDRQLFKAALDLPARARLPSLFESFAKTCQVLLVIC